MISRACEREGGGQLRTMNEERAKETHESKLLGRLLGISSSASSSSFGDDGSQERSNVGVGSSVEGRLLGEGSKSVENSKDET